MIESGWKYVYSTICDIAYLYLRIFNIMKNFLSFLVLNYISIDLLLVRINDVTQNSQEGHILQNWFLLHFLQLLLLLH